MSSKLQEIQSTQVLFRCHPRYTSTSVHKHTLFLYFSDFPPFFIKSKKKKKKNKNKKKEGTNILKRKTRDRKQMAMHERGRERSCQENNTNVLV